MAHKKWKGGLKRHWRVQELHQRSMTPVIWYMYPPSWSPWNSGKQEVILLFFSLLKAFSLISRKPCCMLTALISQKSLLIFIFFSIDQWDKHKKVISRSPQGDRERERDRQTEREGCCWASPCKNMCWEMMGLDLSFHAGHQMWIFYCVRAISATRGVQVSEMASEGKNRAEFSSEREDKFLLHGSVSWATTFVSKASFYRLSDKANILALASLKK